MRSSALFSWLFGVKPSVSSQADPDTALDKDKEKEDDARGNDILFFCSSYIDEIWIRSTALATQEAGYSCGIAITDDASPLAAQRQSYLAAGIRFKDRLSFAEAATLPAYLIITASSGVDRTILPTQARYLVHMPHSLASLHMIYPKDAFLGYDALFSCGPHHDAEFQEICAHAGIPARPSFAVGYGKLDILQSALDSFLAAAKPCSVPHVLVAPSWGPENLLEAIGVELVDALLAQGWQVTVRPHPLLIIERAPVLAQLAQMEQENDALRLELNMISNHAMLAADLLIGDYSGTSFEFAALRGKPVVSVDLGKKIVNPAWERFNVTPIELAMRPALGEVCAPRTADIVAAVHNQLRIGPPARSLTNRFLHVPPGGCAPAAVRAIRVLMKEQ